MRRNEQLTLATMESVGGVTSVGKISTGQQPPQWVETQNHHTQKQRVSQQQRMGKTVGGKNPCSTAQVMNDLTSMGFTTTAKGGNAVASRSYKIRGSNNNSNNKV